MPMVKVFLKLKFPEWLAIIVSTLLFLVPLASALYFLVHEIQLVIKDIPRITTSLNELMTRIITEDFPRFFHIDVSNLIPNLTERILGTASKGLGLVLVGARQILEAGIQGFLIFILALVVIITRKSLHFAIETLLVDPKNPEFNPKLIEKIADLVEQFLITRLLIVVVVTVLDFIALQVFGIEYSFILALFLGIMTLIPAVGFIIGLTPTVIITLSFHHSTGQMIGLFISLVVVSVLESHILSPKLLGDRLNLNLLSTFLGLLAFGLLWGVWGVFLGVPILASLRIAFSVYPSLQRWGTVLSNPRNNTRLKPRK